MCIDFSVPEFLKIKEFLYYPQGFRLAVHGIQRIWKAFDLDDYATNAGLILDTEIMAYLLNSGKRTSEYSLSHLVHEYLSEEYPVWNKVFADNAYPESIRGILAYDAHLVYDVSHELLEIMHNAHHDLKFMYFHIEAPLVRILLEMSRYGIGVDGLQAATVYRKVLTARKKLESQQITGSAQVDLWKGEEVYQLLRAHEIRFYSSSKKATHDDSKRLALKYPVAAQILELRDMATDLSFLGRAAGAERIYPQWEIMSRTGRIHASNPAVQKRPTQVR